MKKLLLFIFLFHFITACNISDNKKNEIPIARAYKNLLYLSDIKSSIPDNISDKDSILYVKKIIDKWLKDQLLLEKAELNLSKEQKDISNLLDNYRSSLLIHRYTQNLLKQKLDTTITLKNIEEYYATHSGEFRLNNNIIKAIYVQLPIATYDAYKVRRWYKSDDIDDLNDLEDYCYEKAHKFDLQLDWILFDDFLKKIPLAVKDQGKYLESNKFFETKDSLYKYFVSIKEYKLKNDTTPIFYVKSEIKDIILRNRKLKFISELENNLYQDALNQNNIEIN
ncbi:MAG: hypothetical protein KAT68_14505 [Bacteroidales bacterium]|nr:hypothetical protein [Bacteroidales bacterium]